MGQNLSRIFNRIFNFIFGSSSSRNGKSDPDLEKGLSSPTNHHHPPESPSSALSSTSTSSCTGVHDTSFGQPNTLQVNESLGLIYESLYGNLVAPSSPDHLENGLSNPPTNNPNYTFSSSPFKLSSNNIATSSCNDHAGVLLEARTLFTSQLNSLQVNKSTRLISDEHDENLVAPASVLELDESEAHVDIVVEKEITCVTLIDHPKEDEKTEEEKEVKPERWIKCYSSCQMILLVGEGDFSFSSCLASAFVSATNMVATSLDSREFLARNYRKAISNIRNLQRRGCMVIHEVDATEMATHPLLKDLKFDRIIYNFPLAGFFKNQPRQTQLMTNQVLVMEFMENAKRMIREEGEIHITHKSNGFFLDWDMTALASYSGLRLLEELRFRRADYPGYCTKYGFGGDKNFNCFPSNTYKFGLVMQKPQSRVN